MQHYVRARRRRFCHFSLFNNLKQRNYYDNVTQEIPLSIKNIPMVVNISVARIFDWGGNSQITCNDVIKTFSKKKLFVRQRYRRMKDL